MPNARRLASPVATPAPDRRPPRRRPARRPPPPAGTMRLATFSSFPFLDDLDDSGIDELATAQLLDVDGKNVGRAVVELRRRRGVERDVGVPAHRTGKRRHT